MANKKDATDLSAVLNKWFATLTREDGSEYSNDEVANWCVQYTGESFSREYLRQIRRGIKTNPTKRHLESLAAFFHADPAELLTSTRSREDDHEVLKALEDTGVSAIALRAVNLDLADRKRVLEQIQRIQREKTDS